MLLSFLHCWRKAFNFIISLQVSQYLQVKTPKAYLKWKGWLKKSPWLTFELFSHVTEFPFCLPELSSPQLPLHCKLTLVPESACVHGHCPSTDRYFWGSSHATAEAPRITSVLVKSNLFRLPIRHKRLYFNSSVKFKDHFPSRVT